MDFSPDGRWLAALSMRGASRTSDVVQIWDTKNWQLVSKIVKKSGKK